jgi:hypothetical protein
MNKKILQLELKKREIKTNHFLYFVLTVLTGIWGLVWIGMTFINSSKRSKIDDEIYKVKLMESYEER